MPGKGCLLQGVWIPLCAWHHTCPRTPFCALARALPSSMPLFDGGAATPGAPTLSPGALLLFLPHGHHPRPLISTVAAKCQEEGKAAVSHGCWETPGTSLRTWAGNTREGTSGMLGIVSVPRHHTSLPVGKVPATTSSRGLQSTSLMQHSPMPFRVQGLCPLFSNAHGVFLLLIS